MDVGEVEAGACLVGDGVVEVRTGKMPYILGVIVIVVRVVILGGVVVLVFQLVIVLELVALVWAHAVLEVVLVVGGTVVPVVIVCHELPFSCLACSALRALDVEEAHVLGVRLDEVLALLDLGSHEVRYGALGRHGVIDGHLEKDAVLGLHGG